MDCPATLASSAVLQGSVVRLSTVVHVPRTTSSTPPMLYTSLDRCALADPGANNSPAIRTPNDSGATATFDALRAHTHGSFATRRYDYALKIAYALRTLHASDYYSLGHPAPTCTIEVQALVLHLPLSGSDRAPRYTHALRRALGVLQSTHCVRCKVISYAHGSRSCRIYLLSA